MSTSNIGQYNESAPVLSDNEQRALRLDSRARLIITQEKRETFSAAISAHAVQSGATDFLEVIGSATKTIIIKRMRFGGTANGTVVTRVGCVKRSTADSGGTSATLTNVPHDSVNAAATATVKAYTANPTLGTAIGLIRTFLYTMVAVSSNIIADIRELTFGTEEDQGIILRGTSQSLCLNLNETVLTNALVDVSIEWREVVG